MTPPKIRAKKARYASKLACGCHVRPGEQIVRYPDGKWRCARCLIAALRAAEQALR